MLAAVLLFSGTRGNAQKRDYYQIKIYRVENTDQVALLDAYFRDAYLPALHRAGIPDVGVFKPAEGTSDEGKFILLLIPFSSLDEFENLGSDLAADQVYQSDGRAYIEAPYDHPPYTRIESFLLKGFSAMPHYGVPELDTPPSERIFELRSYQSATELLYQRKVEMFNDAGEVALFRELEFNPVFFGEVLSSAHMPHLMYMISFSDTLSQQRHWETFGAHPDWIGMRDMERYANTVSNITSYSLHPTDYSDF